MGFVMWCCEALPEGGAITSSMGLREARLHFRRKRIAMWGEIAWKKPALVFFLLASPVLFQRDMSSTCPFDRRTRLLATTQKGGAEEQTRQFGVEAASLKARPTTTSLSLALPPLFNVCMKYEAKLVDGNGKCALTALRRAT
uniref:Secreted protein n=1 Tax=Panagrellus redivivus TaxID=6233 RepID=A0A7E4W7S6_PANRE